MKRTLATFWILLVSAAIIGIAANVIVAVVEAARHGDEFAQFLFFVAAAICAVTITGWAINEVLG